MLTIGRIYYEYNWFGKEVYVISFEYDKVGVVHERRWWASDTDHFDSVGGPCIYKQLKHNNILEYWSIIIVTIMLNEENMTMFCFMYIYLCIWSHLLRERIIIR